MRTSKFGNNVTCLDYRGVVNLSLFQPS
jgi:hypothetical protein